jgi:hypothetical protein
MSGANQLHRVQQHAADGLYADLLPPSGPTLQQVAIRALKAATFNEADKDEAKRAFFSQLETETGLSENLLHLLIYKGVIA